jgi:hypothetical protein
MITITVEVDSSGAMDMLAGLEKQVKFATAVALTKTALEAKEAMPAAMEKALDKPTPFTKRGIFTRRATPANLEAVVGIMDAQANYLRYQIEGGTRLPGAGGLRLPAAINVDEFGNIPKGLIKKLIAIANKEKKLGKVKARRIKVSNKVDLFYGDPEDNGRRPMPRGIYKRIDLGNGRGQLIPLVVFPVVSAKYRPRFNFEKEVAAVVAKEWDKQFAEAFAYAERTAR